MPTTELKDLLAALLDPIFHNGVESDSLLDYLKARIFIGMESGGSNSGLASRPPLATAAFDLYTQIEEESAALLVGAPRHKSRGGREEGIWGQFGKWDQVAGNLPTQLTQDAVNAFAVKKWRYAEISAEANIRAWVKTISTEYQQLIAAKIINRWLDRIKRLLFPESRREFLGECPSCGARWHHDRGGGIRSAAVIITFPNGIARADCQACPETWVGGYAVLDMKFRSEMREASRAPLTVCLIDSGHQNA